MKALLRILTILGVIGALVILFHQAIFFAVTILIILFILTLPLPFGRTLWMPILMILSFASRVFTSLVWGGLSKRSQQPPLIRTGGKKKTSLKDLSQGGLLIVGAYREAVRSVISEALRSGRRVLVLGHVSLVPKGLKPEDLRVIPLWRVRFNVLRMDVFKSGEERVRRREEAERIALALTVSEGLDAAEVGMVARFLEIISKNGGAVSSDDLELLRSEYGTHGARLKDPLNLLIDFFNDPYPRIEELVEGQWRVCVLDGTKLSHSLRLFSQLYALMTIRETTPDAVFVLSEIEFVLPDINVLPYDARNVWLRLYRHLEGARDGLIMATSNPYAATQLMDISDKVLLVDPPLSFLSYLRRSFGLSLSQDKGPHLIVRSHEGWSLSRIELPVVEPVSTEEVRMSARMVVESIRSKMTEVYRNTVLFVDFADNAESAYRILRAVKYQREPDERSVATEAEADVGLVRELVKKGYIATTDGRLVITQLGQNAMSDFEAKVRGRMTERREDAEPEAGLSGDERAGNLNKPVQTGLPLFTQRLMSPSELGEYWRIIGDARVAYGAGKYIQAIKMAYKGIYSVLKSLTGQEKGRLRDLVSIARSRGIVNIEDSEAKRAVAAIALAGRVQKQLAQGDIDQEMEKRLEFESSFMIELLERILVTLEGAALQDEGHKNVSG